MNKNNIHVSFFFLTTALFVSALSARAEEPAKKWKNVAEVSAVTTNGNSKSNSFSAKEAFTFGWLKSNLELIGTALSNKSKGTTTAEKYSAGEKYTYNFTAKNYAYQKFLWEKDRFSGIKGRFDNSVGLGREVLSTQRNLLNLEAGAGYITEDRIRARTNKFASGRAFGKYVFKISDTSNFSQTAEYLQSFKDGEDFRVNTESALTATISTHLSMKLSYVWNHVAMPPAGFSRNDTTTTVALVSSY